MKIIGWLLVMGFLSPEDGLVHVDYSRSIRFDQQFQCEDTKNDEMVLLSYRAVYEKQGDFRIWCEPIVK